MGVEAQEGLEALKTAIVDTLIAMMEAIPAAKEPVLLQLCECIEDCDFPRVIIRVLHVLSAEGASAVAPGRFTRFLYNRVILEGAAVRAAALQALGRFAARVPSVRRGVEALLTGALGDENDEARERAVAALAALRLLDARQNVETGKGVDCRPVPLENRGNRGNRRMSMNRGMSVENRRNRRNPRSWRSC